MIMSICLSFSEDARHQACERIMGSREKIGLICTSSKLITLGLLDYFPTPFFLTRHAALLLKCGALGDGMQGICECRAGRTSWLMALNNGKNDLFVFVLFCVLLNL